MTWNHQICEDCYGSQRTLAGLPPKEPVRLVPAIFDMCCWCGRWNNSGIYIRHDPALLACEHFSEQLT